MKSGKILWKYPVPSGTESSPIVVGNSVYFGDQGGTEYSLNIKTGHRELVVRDRRRDQGRCRPTTTATSTSAPTAAASTPSNAKTGKQVWEQSPGGEFYSTPAIGYGRVYVGNNNGAAYSFVASNGTAAWTRVLGSYVYSGPAVADPKGLGPTVYIGYYSGQAAASTRSTRGPARPSGPTTQAMRSRAPPP